LFVHYLLFLMVQIYCSPISHPNLCNPVHVHSHRFSFYDILSLFQGHPSLQSL